MGITERKILLVDDQVEILDMVESHLRKRGFQYITRSASCAEAKYALGNDAFDFGILDIMLPDGSGFDILKEIRKNSEMPVLFLSAVSDIDHQYRGFELGADDYIVKPFQLRDLELRVRSILKRAYPDALSQLVLGDALIDFDRVVVFQGEESFPLTAKEYQILRVLAEQGNKIVTFDRLLARVWGEAYEGYNNSLMAHIRKIRQKIEKDPSKPVYLLTVKGLGYKLVVDKL